MVLRLITHHSPFTTHSTFTMLLTIIRTYYSGGTNGQLYINNSFLCHTIELPWKNNLPNRSCIPEGMYILSRRWSPKHKWHIEVEDVKHRSLILFHPANDAVKELKGCIAPVTELTGEGKGTQSRIAFNKLLSEVFLAMKQEIVYLRVTSGKR
jgi:hypothetical protein